MLFMSAWNEGDSHAGLHQQQLGLKVLDFGDDPHGRMQRIKQIKDMPAAARTALGMSDDDILAVKVRRVEIGSTDKGVGFRERRQPFLGPHRIADDCRALDRRKHQAEVDLPALQRPNLCNGWKLQQVEMHVGPLLSIGRDNARQRAGHHVLRCGPPQPATLAVGHRSRHHLRAIEVFEHLPHVFEKRADDCRQPCAMFRFAQEQVRAQLVIDITDISRDGRWTGSEP
jgi:hypothetical protein